MSIDPTLLDDLEWRGLIAHSTDLAALREALTSGSVRFYVGFDPTAPSLHMGNLLQLITARRLQDAGHTPYILVGGATGMIGDPKDSGERTLNSLDTVKDWSERVRRQVEPFVSFEGANAATMVNNYDWTASLSTIDFLRDIGKHFPVNRMLARDVVKRRLESGISYTEFSYVLLQSMDFLNLYRDHGVTLQFGGERPVGQHHRRRRADPPRRRRQGPRVRDAAGHQARRHEVRQDRGRRAVARPADDVAVRLPPVVAQRRRRAGGRAAADLHVPRRAPRSRRSRRRPPRSRGCAPARSGWPTRSPRSSTAPRRPSRPRPPRLRCSAAATSTRLSPDHARGRAARGRGGLGGRSLLPGGRPAGRDRAGQEQGRGPAHDQRGRRLPQQRPGRGPRGRAPAE